MNNNKLYDDIAKTIARKNMVIYDCNEDIANGIMYPTVHSEKECYKSSLKTIEKIKELDIELALNFLKDYFKNLDYNINFEDLEEKFKNYML